MDTLRMTVGFLIITSHIVSFALILLGGSLTVDERVELSLIISPIFAVYITAVVRKIVTMVVFDSTPVHPALTILGTGTAIVFALAIPAVIWSFEEGRIQNFGGLKSVVGIVEASLGLYTGAIIDRLFGSRGAAPAGTSAGAVGVGAGPAGAGAGGQQ